MCFSEGFETWELPPTLFRSEANFEEDTCVEVSDGWIDWIDWMIVMAKNSKPKHEI